MVENNCPDTQQQEMKVFVKKKGKEKRYFQVTFALSWGSEVEPMKVMTAGVPGWETSCWGPGLEGTVRYLYREEVAPRLDSPDTNPREAGV
jgi:hypothetical protein